DLRDRAELQHFYVYGFVQAGTRFSNEELIGNPVGVLAKREGGNFSDTEPRLTLRVDSEPRLLTGSVLGPTDLGEMSGCGVWVLRDLDRRQSVLRGPENVRLFAVQTSVEPDGRLLATKWVLV